MKNITCLLIVVISALLISPLSGGEEKKDMELKGKKVLMVIAPKDFRDEEYRKPRDFLEGKGAEITVASSKKKKCVGMLKEEEVTPDILLKDAKASEYDAIIFVGGSGAKKYFNSKIAHKLAQEAVKSDKITTAICIAPVILARAGVLKDRKATVFPDRPMIKELEKAGAEYVKDSVVEDGNIITGNGPEAAESFAKAVAKALSSK